MQEGKEKINPDQNQTVPTQEEEKAEASGTPGILYNYGAVLSTFLYYPHMQGVK